MMRREADTEKKCLSTLLSDWLNDLKKKTKTIGKRSTVAVWAKVCSRREELMDEMMVACLDLDTCDGWERESRDSEADLESQPFEGWEQCAHIERRSVESRQVSILGMGHVSRRRQGGKREPKESSRWVLDTHDLQCNKSYGTIALFLRWTWMRETWNDQRIRW
jgi:hypothetical protein